MRTASIATVTAKRFAHILDVFVRVLVILGGVACRRVVTCARAKRHILALNCRNVSIHLRLVRLGFISLSHLSFPSCESVRIALKFVRQFGV
jgi:hypothetical protein